MADESVTLTRNEDGTLTVDNAPEHALFSLTLLEHEERVSISEGVLTIEAINGTFRYKLGDLDEDRRTLKAALMHD